jgi:hypothetical protein
MAAAQQAVKVFQGHALAPFAQATITVPLREKQSERGA